jgi:hypothetical protein
MDEAMLDKAWRQALNADRAWFRGVAEAIRRDALEEAARVCEAYVWFEDGNRSPDESNRGCADAIRALKEK